MFNDMLMRLNSITKDDVERYVDRKSNLSDICISHFNENVGKFSSREFYQMMSNKEKFDCLANALSFRVGEVCKLDDDNLKKLMANIREDKPIKLFKYDAKSDEIKTLQKLRT